MSKAGCWRGCWGHWCSGTRRMEEGGGGTGTTLCRASTSFPAMKIIFVQFGQVLGPAQPENAVLTPSMGPTSTHWGEQYGVPPVPPRSPSFSPHPAADHRPSGGKPSRGGEQAGRRRSQKRPGDAPSTPVPPQAPQAPGIPPPPQLRGDLCAPPNLNSHPWTAQLHACPPRGLLRARGGASGGVLNTSFNGA